MTIRPRSIFATEAPIHDAGGGMTLRLWLLVGGLAMIAMGVLAVLDTPLVGMPQHAFMSMNAMHGEVHALGGVLAILVATFLRGSARAYAIFGYGALFVLGFVLNVMSPDFFGMMPDAPANMPVHVMHATVALLSLWAGYMELR